MAMKSSNLGVSFFNISTPFSRFFCSNSKNELFDRCHELLRKNSIRDLNDILDKEANGAEPNIVFYLVSNLALKGFVPSEHTLRMMMKSAVSLNDYKLGDSVFCLCLKRGEFKNEYIISTYLKNHGHEPMAVKSVLSKLLSTGYETTTITYNVILNSYLMNNKIEKALELFERMKQDEKTHPSLVSYSSVVSSLCKKNNIDLALKYLEEMKSLGLLPNEITMTPVIKTLVSLERYSEVDEYVFDEKLGCGTATYNVLVDHFAKQKEMRKVLAMVQHMVKKGIKLNVITFNTVLDGYRRSNDPVSMTRVYQVMDYFGVTQNVNTVNIVVNCYAKTGHLEKAFDVFQKVFDKNIVVVDAFTFTPLVQELFKKGRVDEAVDLYSKMRGRGIKETQVSLVSYLHGLCESGRLSDALFYFGKLRDKRLKPNLVVFNLLILWTSRVGLYEDTLSLLKDLVSRGLEADNATYKALAGHITQGHHVKELVTNLCGAGVPVKEAYNNLALACYKKGQSEDATWLFKEMVQKDISISEDVLYQMRKKSLQEFEMKRGR